MIDKGMNAQLRIGLLLVIISIETMGLACIEVDERVSKELPFSRAPAVWVLQPSDLGYPLVSDFDQPNDFAAKRSLAFSDDGAIALSFRVSEYGKEGRLAFTHHLATVDVGSGKPLRRAEWPSAKGSEPYVFAAHDGKFLVTNGEWIAAYTSSLQPVRKMELKPGTRIVQVSPDGRTLGREEGDPFHPKLVFLDSETFQETGLSFDSNVRSISNSQMAIERWPKGTSNAAIELSAAEGKRTLLQTDCREALPYFLSAQFLLVTCRGRLVVLKTSGEVVFADEYGDAKVGFAAVSRDGRRFAVSVSKWSQEHFSHLVDEVIVVYEVAKRSPIVAVRAEPLPYMQSSAALSRDGALLAVASRGTLRLFKVP